MADAKKSLYNVALANQGYLLTNIARKRPRTMNQSSVFGTRFAQGDRSYLDFNLWWYWAQSEWSNGFKDKVSWADDGKYYFSSNIDAFSKVGSLQLMKNVVTKISGSFIGKKVTCGLSINNPFVYSGDSFYTFIGAGDSFGNSEIVRIKESDFTLIDIIYNTTVTMFPTQFIYKNNTLWILQQNYYGYNAGILETWDATNTLVDHSGYSAYNLAHTTDGATCGVVFGQYIYVAQNSQQYGYNAIVKTSLDSPFSGESNTDWSKVLDFYSQGIIVDIFSYNNLIYYIVSYGVSAELYVFDPLASPLYPSLVWTFTGTSMSTINNLSGYNQYTNYAGKLMFSQGGKLVITMPDREVWSWDGTNMNRVFLIDDYKNNILSNYILGYEATGYLHKGGVKKGDNIYWSNLMYDGYSFFNTIKTLADDVYHYYPLFSDRNGLMWGLSSADDKTVYQETTTYKGSAGKNFLVFSQNDVISTIDKIFHHATFNFNYLATGESIIIEYLLSDLTPTSNAAWINLGSASFTNDGATINTKTIYFPDNTVGKKMWLRVKLEGNGSTTPTFNDIAIAYLPMPDLKHDWTLYLECYDNMMLLDGKTKETKRGEELKSLLKFNWWSKTAMDFQDVDYAESLLNGAITDPTATTITVDSTLDFPQQGRLRIEQEEILYTGKSATTFTGCTRGARGSLATTHTDNALVATNYKVIIQSLEEFTPELQNIKVKNEESVVVLSLREL